MGLPRQTWKIFHKSEECIGSRCYPWESELYINCIGALGMNISTNGALGRVVSHFVRWQVSQEDTNDRIYADISGPWKRSFNNACNLSIPKYAISCYFLTIIFRNDGGMTGHPDFVKIPTSTLN